MSKIKPEKWIGQTRMMKCGMKATVIAYRNFNDIDVQFENGTIHELWFKSHYYCSSLCIS